MKTMRSPMCEKMRPRAQEAVDRAVRAGALAARVGLGHTEATGCRFEGGRLKETGSSESLSYAVEVIVDHRRGAASGNRIEDLGKMTDRALELAKAGSIAHFDTYPAPAEVTPVKTHSDRTFRLSREKMIESCEQIVDALKAYNPDLFTSCGAGRSESEGLFLTSGGVCHVSRQTGWSLHSQAQRTQGTDILFASYGRGWADLNEFFDPAVVIERVLADLRNAEKNVEPPRGKVKAYIPAEVVPALCMPIHMGINGRNVAKGDSPLAGRLGEQVLAPSITVTDNPHVDYSGGAREIDSAGIPTRKQTLFENGVLQRFLYDFDSAALAGAEPTGNDGCSAYWPMIQPGTRR